MKKVLFSAALMMVSCLAFGQVKAVKEAKAQADAAKFDAAIASIEGALVNDETKDLAETWNVAGYVYKKIGEAENTKLYLKKEADEEKLYDAVYKMFVYYTKCDELAQLPDAKGKVNNKYRKNNAAAMAADRGNLANGGVVQFNQNNYAKAYDFFGMYIDSAKNPMLLDKNYEETDTLMPVFAYYATLAALKQAQEVNGDEAAAKECYHKALKYAPIGAQDPENGKFALEFQAIAQKELGETEPWLATLKEGVAKHPEHDFFFANLVDYYTNTQKYDEAIQFADEMIAQQGETAFYAYVKGYLYQSKKDYANAAVAYQKAVELNPEYAEAYSNLGLCYEQQAIEFGETATSDLYSDQYAKDQKKIKEFYQNALPNYERARELKPDNRELWLNNLYRVYYNLGNAEKFNEMEELINRGY